MTFDLNQKGYSTRYGASIHAKYGSIRDSYLEIDIVFTSWESYTRHHECIVFPTVFLQLNFSHIGEISDGKYINT